MDDATFLVKTKEKIEKAVGCPIELRLGYESKGAGRVAVDFSGAVPVVTFGADALKHAGLARMFSQYAILCLKERHQVSEQEFFLFLRRN